MREREQENDWELENGSRWKQKRMVGINQRRDGEMLIKL